MRDDWKTIARESISVRAWQETIKTFRGDPKLAASYLPLARTVLGGAIHQARLGGIGYHVRSVTLPDGTAIRATVNSGIYAIEIEAGGITPGAAEILLPAFVFYQCNDLYPYGVVVEQSGLIRKTVPFIVEGFDVITIDEVEIREEDPHYFTFLSYAILRDLRFRYAILNNRAILAGNHFYRGASQKWYSFWFTDRGDFPAAVLFATDQESALDDRLADSGLYSFYLLYDDAQKVCYGTTYQRKYFTDPSLKAARTIGLEMYCNGKELLSNVKLTGFDYILGVGEFDGVPIIIVSSGGFLISAYTVERGAPHAIGVVAELTVWENSVDVPANFKWKFSASGERFAGFYYNRERLYEGDLTIYRVLKFVEFQLQQNDGVLSFTKIREEQYIGSAQQTIDITTDTSEEHTTGPNGSYSDTTTTLTHATLQNIREQESPIAFYYHGETVRFVKLRVETTTTIEVTQTVDDFQSYQYIPVDPPAYSITMPAPGPSLQYNYSTWPCVHYDLFKTGTQLDHEYATAERTRVRLIFEREGSSTLELTDLQTDGMGQKSSHAQEVDYQWWTAMQMVPVAYFNDDDFYTDSSSDQCAGFVGQVLHLNAELGLCVWAKAVHQHDRTPDHGDYQCYRLDYNFSGTPEDVYYESAIQPSAKGYATASDAVTVEFKHYCAADHTDRAITSISSADLADADSQTYQIKETPGWSGPTAFIFDYLNMISAQSEYERTASFIFPDAIAYGHAGILGSFSCCPAWDQASQQTRPDAQDADISRLAYVCNFRGESNLDLHEVSRFYTSGVACPDVAVRFVDSPFGPLQGMVLESPDLFPIRWIRPE